jgi:hypothetical protein
MCHKHILFIPLVYVTVRKVARKYHLRRHAWQRTFRVWPTKGEYAPIVVADEIASRPSFPITIERMTVRAPIFQPIAQNRNNQ